MSRRDESLPAEHWRPLSPGVYARAGSVPCVVRGRPGAWWFTLGRDAALPAGATLLRATEHAGGHAATREAGIGDRVGVCVECGRLRAAEMAAKEATKGDEGR